MMIRLVATVLLILGVPYAQAQSLNGYVVGISDGDTLTLLVNWQQHRIRIAGIDAPEHFQAYGNRSRTNLSKYAFHQDAKADCYKKDIYGREVCKIWVKSYRCSACGTTLDLGLTQVTDGMAWWDRNHAGEQSQEDRQRYESAETMAKLRRLGLWADAKPIPPWVWRHTLTP
ncbi:MAG: thermonuclease family protein [Thiobacillaceae bacterium]